jgi:hypothetical protein
VLGRATEVAAPDAVEAVVAGAIELNRRENGEAAGVELAASFRHGAVSPEDLAVSVAAAEVVSCVVLFRMQLELGGDPRVRVAVGQPEFVATDPAYRNRGFVRRLTDLVHRWSADRGDLVQLIGGIPYFYRQLGYQYGLVRPRERLIPPELSLPPSAGWELRRATASDIPAMRRLQDATQQAADVRLPWSPEVWPVLVDLPHGELAVVAKDGVVRGLAYLRGEPGWPVHVQGLAADSFDAAVALLHHGRARRAGSTLVVQDRPASPVAAVLGASSLPVPKRKWLYLRVADPVVVLDRMRPVLSQRLAGSVFCRESGSVVVSFYRSAARIEHREGEIVTVTPCPPVAEPAEAGASGVPPDLTASLFFGEGGIAALEDHPDVELGPHRHLLHVLFPPQHVDAMIW